MAMSINPAGDSVDLRRGVDHIGVSASFVVHDGKGNLLLQQRGPRTRDEQGRWDVGGGAIEFGETIEDAIRREIKEELTCNVLDMAFLTVYDAHRRLADGTKTHWVAVIYAVRVDPIEVAIGEPDKIAAVGWFTSNSLPSPLHSQFQKSFQAALANKVVV